MGIFWSDNLLRLDRVCAPARLASLGILARLALPGRADGKHERLILAAGWRQSWRV